ncbi:MAG: type II toxin-antitoxin system RelE/ParE family toxin [Campylobacterota bacterium]|nr:type II toxin-antitoxin system RelE/ParE family toxin [Campylobacterota bacterium]
MNYNITFVDTFKLELKKLSKKYKNIKNDYKKLLEILSTSNPKDISVYLGKNCYKIRLKNSDNNKGKSSGYRIIYLYLENDLNIILLSIYSKSDLENISEQDIDSKILEAINELDNKNLL